MAGNFNEMLLEICNEIGVKCSFLSNNWVTVFEKNGKTGYLIGRKFDLNGHATGLILDDKFALYCALKEKNIPVIEHNLLYSEDNLSEYVNGLNSYDVVEDFFENHDKNIVIKPNDGMCGRGVFHITEASQIRPALKQLFEKSRSVSFCPFYKIRHEYRFIMLGRKVKLSYAKCLPEVVGDGKHTIKELLLSLNSNYFENHEFDGSEFDDILKTGQKYTFGWKFNLSQGSTTKPIEDKKLYDQLLSIATKVVDELNLGFVSVDIIETENNELLVLEVNSGIGTNKYVGMHPENYESVKNIYKEAIEMMLK
ncbi:MAG: hypothetical protein IJ538_03125 [Clostridia bacterium]|nr:hypothetical protein [Clostridia bacterium]